jgi:DNA-binding HxlR family transcriptional regulator
VRGDVEAAQTLRAHITSRWGISEKMLPETLRALDRDGFVHRDAQPVIPPHVEYSLTPLGREVGEQVWALTQRPSPARSG